LHGVSFLFVFSFHFTNLSLREPHQEVNGQPRKYRTLIYGIVSITFFVGGIFVLLIGKAQEQLWAIAAILLCGALGGYYFWKFKKEK
jgi:L-asparagine transporter-like permease